MKETLKPIFLLADSQLLFYNNGSGLFLKKIKELLKPTETVDEIKAAYIGASNNDNPQFYEIFQAAMQQVEITACRMIKSTPGADDDKFLKDAALILLAGGDTEKGWGIIKQNGWDEIIRDRYTKGAILIGVSAGAVQLGVKAYNKSGKKLSGFYTLQLVPFIIDVHANDSWHNLRKQVELDGGQLKGYGIPFGAGVIFYPDMSIEAVRYSCTEVTTKDEVVSESIILPSQMQKEVNN